MPKHRSYKFTHNCHGKLKQTQVVRGVGESSTESHEKISQFIKNHFPTSMTQQFLELTIGGRLLPNSMAKLRACVLMNKLNCDGSETTAETLARLLVEDRDTLHVSYTGSY